MDWGLLKKGKEDEDLYLIVAKTKIYFDIRFLLTIFKPLQFDRSSQTHNSTIGNNDSIIRSDSQNSGDLRAPSRHSQIHQNQMMAE